MPASTNHAEEPQRPRSSFRPTASTWIVGAVLVLSAIIGTASSGVAGFLSVLSIAALITGVYVLVTGRQSWAKLPSRKLGMATLAAGLVFALVGGASGQRIEPDRVSAESPTASATSGSSGPEPKEETGARFTDEAPADPARAVTPSEAVSVAVADASVTRTTAVALLATLTVKDRAPKTGYGRSSQFGAAWLDVDRNGCDTRNDILGRDLSGIRTAGPCKVLSGALVSPYTAAPVEFVRGNDTSALVQIDHVVALSNAWQTGAQQLTPAQRRSFANDPLNLLAVDGDSNSQKGDGDAATWLPRNKDFRCAYVARQVSVKVTYGLWVTPPERDAIARVLGDCAREPAMTSDFAPDPQPVPAPVAGPAPVPVAAPTPAPAPAPAAYYENCDAVRSAGAAPIRVGQPGYSRQLDRDGDGVGCEP